MEPVLSIRSTTDASPSLSSNAIAAARETATFLSGEFSSPLISSSLLSPVQPALARIKRSSSLGFGGTRWHLEQE